MCDLIFLRQAILKAKESVAQGGFPAGSVVVKAGEIVAEGISIGNQLNDPTSHSDIVSIRKACKHLKTSDLSGATLYSSMEPCLMCFGASAWSSISRIVFACRKEKVSSIYYGGNYSIANLNVDLLHSIELVHCLELEEESLALVWDWERDQK